MLENIRKRVGQVPRGIRPELGGFLERLLRGLEFNLDLMERKNEELEKKLAALEKSVAAMEKELQKLGGANT